jgi:hypothetical protein
MARNSVDVIMEKKLVENEQGRMVPGCVATCGECDHKEQSYGQGIASQKRCLAMLRENCPEGKSNFYVDPDSDEDD